MRQPAEVHVLVVDDEPDIREFLASVLEDAGMEVETAEDGNVALERIKARTPDLVSLDLVMPGKSGIRLLHELRKNNEWSRIPVVIVTGHARDTDIKKDLDAVLAESTMSGPSSFLEKPVTPQGYLENICRLLDVEVPDLEPRPSSADGLRREAESMLANADRATLEAILDKLKKDKKES
ncbi:MAG: response regulator [bacterium]